MDDEEDDSKIFPQKLMEILSNPDNADSICWMPHGKSFIIRNRSLFGDKVMPIYFSRKAKYSSFTRKLNRWNFSRVSSGPEMGAYYHEFFLRDKPHLAAQMFCKNARTLAAMQTAKSGDYKKNKNNKVNTRHINDKSPSSPTLPPCRSPPAVSATTINPTSLLSLSKSPFSFPSTAMVAASAAMPNRLELFERQMYALQQEEEANRLLLERALLLQPHHYAPLSFNPLLLREVQQQKVQQERILQLRRAMLQYKNAQSRNNGDRPRAPSNNRASAA